MKLIDDLGHIAWGAWMVACFLTMPPWLAVMAIIVWREVEQTFKAKNRRSEMYRWSWGDHLLRVGYWVGKVRDLAGFGLGAFLFTKLLGG